jgi:pyridoxal phosphate enzyme (YggS family)
MPTIMQRYSEITRELDQRQVRLVAVSKTQPPENILELYRLGHRHFGENRVQELAEKYEALPRDIAWHLIGHLQTNKVRAVVPFVHLIHSIDSLRLLEEVDRQAARVERVVDCLLQFHIAREESKFGFDPAEGRAMLELGAWKALRHVRLCGVMGMATFTDDEAQVRREFALLRAIFNDLKRDFFPSQPHFREISMGMSADWRLAVEEGSTIVRIGSLLFGER